MDQHEMDQQQKSVWEDFKGYTGTYAEVERQLAAGKSVVAVLTAGSSGLGFYDGIDPQPSVMRIKEAMEKRGASLPIGGDGLPRLAYIAWKATDSVTSPTEIATVAFTEDSPTNYVLRGLGLTD
jgi:hypothetical protein